MKRLITFLIFCAVLIGYANGETNIFERVGVGGGRISALVTSPQGDIYAGTEGGGIQIGGYDGTGRIYRSNDNGNTWIVGKGTPKETGVHALAIAPNGNVFAGFTDGIYCSTNKGVSWSSVKSGGSVSNNNHFTVDDIKVSPQGNLFVATYSAGLLRSSNNGTTWTRLNVSPIFDENQNFYQIGITSNGHIFVSNSSYTAPLFCSTDEGQNWTKVNIPHVNFQFPGTIFIDTHDYIYISGVNGLFKSTNDGSTWDSISDVPLSQIKQYTNGDLYGCNVTGMYKSVNGGTQWEHILSVQYGQWIGCITFGSTGSIFAGGTNFFRSENEGMQWNKIGVPNVRVDAFTIGSDGTIYSSFISPDATSSYSTDNGSTFHSLNTNSLCMAVNASGEIFSASLDGITKSTNKGEMWTGVNTTIQPVSMVVNSLGDLFALCSNQTYRSTDNGNTWLEIAEPIHPPKSDYSVSKAQLLAIGKNDVILAGGREGVYRSIDNGVSSSKTLNVTDIFCIATDAIHGYAAAGTRREGVFISTDNGSTWTGTGLTSANILSLAFNSKGELFAGTDRSGIYCTHDLGKKWFQLPGTNVDYVPSMIVNAQGYLFYGSMGDGLYKCNVSTTPNTNNSTYRTFTSDEALSQKGAKLMFKNGVLKNKPNLSTALEAVFSFLNKKGTSFLGVAQPATLAKKYAWVQLTKPTDVSKYFTSSNTIAAYPLDYDRSSGSKVKKLTGAVKPSRKLNNIAWEQGILLKLNILASEYRVTPEGFGELLLNTDATLLGTNLNGQSLKAVSSYYDNVMTYWENYGVTTPTAYAELENFARSILKPINDGFSADISPSNYSIDYFGMLGKSAYPINLEGIKTVTEIGILRENPNKIVEHIVGMEDNTPTQFSLFQNYPNPFNPTTVIRYLLPGNSIVSLKVFNILGQEVATLINNEEVEQGSHDVEFNASNLSSGVYFYRLNVNNGAFTQTKKLVLMK